MTYTMTGVIVGALAGLLLTLLVTLLWPHGKARWARPLVAPLLGIGAAYLLMVLIK